MIIKSFFNSIVYMPIAFENMNNYFAKRNKENNDFLDSIIKNSTSWKIK